MEFEGPVRKRARHRASGVAGGCSAGGPDRLSSLPDCLLQAIMSFLKARQAVQTCVLSTRWKHLWRSVRCLNIDFDEFKNTVPASGNKSGFGGRRNKLVYIGDDSSSSDEDEPVYIARDNHHKEWEYFAKYKDWEDFEDFAVNLMRRCNIAQLDSLQLRLVESRARAPVFSDRQAAGWLRRAMKYCSPDCASQHAGLSSGSWRLKRLNLCHLLLDNGFMKLVSSVCRSLDDLELDHCSGKIQSVTSHSLKTLVLRDCDWGNLSEIKSPTLETLVIDGGSNTSTRMLVILAPAVAYLHLSLFDCLHRGVSINEMPFIAKAAIHLHDHRYSYLGGDQFKLLCSISNSTSLELSGVGATVLGKDPRFQEFKNLRNLLLDNCDLSDDFKTLVFFLRGSPILEKLTLRLCQFPEYPKIKKRPPKLSKTNKTSGLFHSMPLRQRLVTIPKQMSGGAPCARQPSSDLRGLDLLCENLKVEIIYKYGDGTNFMQLLLNVSANLQKKNIKLTKVS